jgi:hypothetical protein
VTFEKMQSVTLTFAPKATPTIANGDAAFVIDKSLK